MRIVSLASGSKGNAYLVESAGAAVLIDCGLSCRELVRRCREAAIDASGIGWVVLTHNHKDHISGLAAFHKRFSSVPVFANAMTAETVARELQMDESAFCCFENGQDFEAGPFKLHPFSIPHDVPDPVGYLVTADGSAYFHATDVGTPLDSIGVQLSMADYATLESNHDAVMLRASDRQECLKRRIRGPRGHLSNDQAADLVRRFASSRLKRLALAHLSSDCNAPHLALGEMRSTLAELNRTDVELRVLAQDEIVEL